MKKALKIFLVGLGVVGIPFTGGLSAIAASSTILATSITLGTAGVSAKRLIDNELEKARREGFRTGHMSGEQSTYEKVKEIVVGAKYNEEYLVALFTVGKFVAGLDGSVTEDELDELNLVYNVFMKMPNISIQTRNKLKKIIESDISLNDLKSVLINLKRKEFISLEEIVYSIILADGQTSKEEEEFLEMWKGLLADENWS